MRWLLACVLLLVLPVDSAAAVRPGDRVALLGDSQAFLLARHLRALAEPDCAFMSESRGGADVMLWSRAMLDSWARIHAFHPSVVLVMLGSNDACEGLDVQRATAPSSMARMLRRLRRLRAREVYWIGPPSIGDSQTLTRAAAGTDLFRSQLAIAAPDIPYMDSREMPLSMWQDLLHPDLEGQVAWAYWIWAKVHGVPDDVIE